MTLNLDADEVEALQRHPGFCGSLAKLAQQLVRQQLGLAAADPYAEHRARERDERGRIVKVRILREVLVGSDAINENWPVLARLKVYPDGRACSTAESNGLERARADYAGEEEALLAWDGLIASWRSWAEHVASLEMDPVGLKGGEQLKDPLRIDVPKPS